MKKILTQLNIKYRTVNIAGKPVSPNWNRELQEYCLEFNRLDYSSFSFATLKFTVVR